MPYRDPRPASHVGRWVQTRSGRLGFGYCTHSDASGLEIVYTDIPGRQEERQRVAPSEVFAPRLARGTRVWVKGQPYGWHAAEITGVTAFGQYLVAVAGINRNLPLSDDQFTLRWERPLSDPAEAVAEGLCDSPEFYEARLPFLGQLVRQRGLSRGYSAVLSSPVGLYQHQLDTVARVLSDPVPRFLLADEVGLGKTVEACLVVRQLLVDDDAATVLITTPSTLLRQWAGELRDRFLLGAELGSGRIRLIAHEDLPVESGIVGHALVVVDEAPRLLPYFARRAGLRGDLQQAKGLLMLSATPMSGDLRVLRTLLNLVDPQAYPEGDLADFASRLKQRASDAAGVRVLTTRRTSSRQRLRALESITAAHPGDAVVTRLAADCRSSRDGDVEPWQRLSEYVRETYRISRRMIRHRRGGPMTMSYPVAGRCPTFVQVDDPTRPLVDAYLEQLRDQLAVEPAQPDDDRYYATAVLSGLGGSRSLLHYLQRPSPSRPAHQALNDATAARLRAIGSDERARVAFDVIADRLAKDLKIVVVGTLVTATQEFFEQARSRWGEAVAGHLAHMDQQTREREIEGFLDRARGQVLVGDVTLEEGRNLQDADVLINLDLPLDPNRLEQRIGRLDRFATRSTPAEIVVFVEPSSAWVTGQIQMLDDGIGIFHTSVATLQGKLNELLNVVIGQLRNAGSNAFPQDTAKLREDLQEEREQVDLLEEVEAVTASADFDDASIAELQRAEADTTPLRTAFETLTRSHAGIGLRFQPQPNGTLRFRTEQHILGLPEDKESDVLALLRRPRTYDREVAVRGKGIAPLRIGDPLVDWIEQYLQSDERGKARAFIRPCDIVQVPTLWLACDFLVEFDASHLRVRAGVRRRLRRRGDAFLAPRLVRTWTDPDGPALPPVVEALTAPFVSGTDTVVRGTVWTEVLAALPDWREICRLSAQEAWNQVRTFPELTTCPEAAVRRARAEVSARISVLRARAERLPLKAERTNAQQELEQEEALGTALLNGIAQPALSMTACGAIILWPRS